MDHQLLGRAFRCRRLAVQVEGRGAGQLIASHRKQVVGGFRQQRLLLLGCPWFAPHCRRHRQAGVLLGHLAELFELFNDLRRLLVAFLEV